MTTNADLTKRARRAMPGGVAHELRWRPEPIYVTHAEGALKWDAEGNRIIDFKMGSASQMLGHSHPDVVAAVTRQATLTPFTADCHLAEIEWAEEVNALFPSADMTRFTGSGTEATMLALRLGRAFSGRDGVLRIDGHYHGWHDHALKGAKPGKAGPPSLGVPGAVNDLISVAPANLGAVEAALNGIGTIIVEVSGANYGAVPLPDGFLASLRKLADQAGAVLVFDEIITGFRWSPGGLQARDGITPDLTTLSKVLTGGLPGGAVAGRSEIMELLDPGLERDGYSPPVSHKGTFNASPLVAAGAVAAMAHLKTGKPQAVADQAAERLRDGLRNVMAERQVRGAVYGESSTFHLFFGECDGTVEGLTPAQ
ncbi:MAG: aspartate aminotransferase family protein, partial [Pikeienuella sp.]